MRAWLAAMLPLLVAGCLDYDALSSGFVADAPVTLPDGAAPPDLTLRHHDGGRDLVSPPPDDLTSSGTPDQTLSLDDLALAPDLALATSDAFCIASDPCLGVECGPVTDACGNIVNCPNTCTGFNTCDGAGDPNRCGCTALTCDQLLPNCNMVQDGCGHYISCPTCPSGQSCLVTGGQLTGMCR
jgi:hypothetical protein